MKKLLFGLALAAAVTLPVCSPLAADFEAPPPDIWSGIYAGVFGGMAFVETDYVPVGSGDPELNGGMGVVGVLAGAQWQWDNLVVGIEGDWGWGTDETAENTLDEVRYDVESIATLRARFGFAFDDTLIYGTGGVALAEANLDAYVLDLDDNATHWGWVVGGGMEHAFFENVTGRIEYLYASFDEDETYDLLPAGTVEMGIDNLHIVRAAFVYKFSL